MEIKTMGSSNEKDDAGKKTDKIFRGSDGEMYSALEIQALASEPWRNNGCLGYAIMALEDLEYPEEKIKEIVRAMRGLFDIVAVGEADQYFCKGPY